MATARKRKRMSADERFMRMIDRFNVVDAVYKDSKRERKMLTTRLRNVVKKRGRGIHHGYHSLINTYDVERRIFDQSKAEAKLGSQKYNQCFRKSKYLHIQGGNLSSPPVEREEPDEFDD